jgi:hypothetical protein
MRRLRRNREVAPAVQSCDRPSHTFARHRSIPAWATQVAEQLHEAVRDAGEGNEQLLWERKACPSGDDTK